MNLTDPKARHNIDRCDGLYDELQADFREFAQGQTDFQIEVFIANGEGPVEKFPVHAYRHILAQVRPLISEIRRVSLEKERLVRKRSRLIAACNEDYDLDVLEIDYKLEDIDIDLRGKWSTYATYDRLMSTLKEKYGPFSVSDLSAQEAEYWRYRLARQMADSRMGAATGVGAGNIDSMRRAIIGSPIPGSNHVIQDNRLSDPVNHFSELEKVVAQIAGPSMRKQLSS